jgi:hypothetical protein
MSNKIEGLVLAGFGFVRVDGLSYQWKSSGQCHARRERVRADVELYGTYGTSHLCPGLIVVITKKGEVWIGGTQNNPCLIDEILELCINKHDNGYSTVRAVFNGTKPLFNTLDLIRRLRECSEAMLSVGT